MANPTVDKMKAFGLLHGEKVAMGATALIFSVCTYFAWSHPSIDVTADEVKKTAKDANANIGAQQSMDTIIAKLGDLGVKLQDFEKKVDVIQSGTVDVAKYKLAKPFVTPEPGAGLIRDLPEFLAPTKLYAHANRGATRVIVVNDDGSIQRVDEPKEAKTGKGKKPKSPARGGMSGGGMSGGGMGRMGGGTTKKKNTGALADVQSKKDEEETARRKDKMLAGAEDVKKDNKPVEVEKAIVNAENAEYALRGFRFINIVGRFDHGLQKEKYAKALKEDPASAAPDYKRLDVERQEKKGDNTWSDWAKVDHERVVEVTGLLKTIEAEIVPIESQIGTLIDPIPFLEVGYLIGAHPASLIPSDEATAKKKLDPTKSGVGASTKMGGGNNFGAADYAKMGKSSGAPGGADYGSSMKSSLNMDFGQNEAAAPARGGPQGTFERSNAEAVMIRALDYDVMPDAVYRYRVRIVFANPNYGWESVAPGVDNRTKEMMGPWSAITSEVNVPPDVATYAQGKTPAAANTGGSQFEFQVVAWNEQDGLTVVHKFDQSPGQIIGGTLSVSLPNSKKPGELKSRPIDFTSHQILADASGGERPVADIQPLGSNRLVVPVVALVIRSDGLLVLRDEAKDATSGDFAEKKAIFDRYMKEEGTAKKPEGGATSPLGGGTSKGAAGNN